MKELQFLIIIIALFQSCGSQTQELDQNDKPNEPEETITFEKYVEVHSRKLSWVQTFLCHRIWDI